MNLWRRFLRLFHFQREFDDEIRAHLALSARDRVDHGESSEQAKRNAEKELGNRTLIRETTRDVWRWSAVDWIGRDLRQTLRHLVRRPGFSIASILTLALGLSATTLVFSILNGVLLEPLRFHDSCRLYVARTVPPADAGISENFPISGEAYSVWRNHCLSCESVALLRFQELTLVGVGQPVKLLGLGVSFNFFRTLGVQPSLGRAFLPDEDMPGHFGEVILSDGLWRSRFGADPLVVGRSFQFNGEGYTVVGVMPSKFHLPKGGEWGAYVGPDETPTIFRPLGINGSTLSQDQALNYTAVIRLKPGVSGQRAAAELDGLLANFKLKTRTTLIPLKQQVTRGIQSTLWLLLAAAGTVLLIVCVNIGNLMIVRAISRYREAAVRMALGASRSHLFALVARDALVLVVLGWAAGLMLTWAGLRIFAASAWLKIPRMEEVQMDWRVLLFSALISALSAILCGVSPAWRISRIEIHQLLKIGAGEDTGKRRTREFLVGLEVALSAILLMIGSLLLLSFLRVLRVAKGFEVANIITQDVSYLSPKYSHGIRRQSVQDTVARLSEIPGVDIAAATNLLPLRGEDWVSDLIDPDQPPRAVKDSAIVNFRFVTQGYWQAMGIPLRQGRFLDTSDQGRHTAVISKGTANYLWPGRSPLGRHVQGANNQTLAVVGVVGDVHSSSLERIPVMIVYEHYWRMQPIAMSFVLRTHGNPLAVANSVRRALSAIDPEMAIPQATMMQQIVDTSVASRKLEMRLITGFAACAVLLAAFGIYGVISFAVARRTREIGIRIALGARPSQLLAMTLSQGMRPVVAGVAAGIAGGMFLNRWIASRLFGIAPSDPFVIGGVTTLLLMVALAACWIPSRRAMRVDPSTALRLE